VLTVWLAVRTAAGADASMTQANVET
jgi:hypothetical protein